MSFDAIVVLGCRVFRKSDAPLHGALGRRVSTALRAFEERGADKLVACGGRSWDGRLEADAMARELIRLGAPADRVVRERCSMSTAENATYAAELARRHAWRSVAIVTCSWHLPRALLLFRREGLVCEGIGADGPDPGLLGRTYRVIRERICMKLDGVTP